MTSRLVYPHAARSASAATTRRTHMKWLLSVVVMIGIVAGTWWVAGAQNRGGRGATQAPASGGPAPQGTPAGRGTGADPYANNAVPYFQAAGSNGPLFTAPVGAAFSALLSLPAGAARGNVSAPGTALLA